MEEVEKMQNFLEESTSNNPVEIQGRLGDLMVYLARSSELLAIAKREWRVSFNEE